MKTDNETYVNEIFDKLDVTNSTVELLKTLVLSRAQQRMDNPDSYMFSSSRDLLNVAENLNNIYRNISDVQELLGKIDETKAGGLDHE